MPSGERALRAVRDLESEWIALNSGGERPQPFRYVRSADELPHYPPQNYFDVIIAGGGLGLIAGSALAQRGLRVLVFDRDRVGVAHREWNISERELRALERWGIFTQDEIARMVATRYERGLISFHPNGTGVPSCPLTTHGVLDVALDAQAVLDAAREHFLAAGGTILEGRSFRRVHMTRKGTPIVAVVEVEGLRGAEFYRTRLAVDMMGSVSSIAMCLNGGLPFDGVCPTVGTVVEGLKQDGSTGDVLVSVSNAQKGRQLIWEGFPGKVGEGTETTVYLFYYDRIGKHKARSQSLLDLFEQYFTLLPIYRAESDKVRHLKPVFGYIPARYGRPGRIATRGVLCLGDSAAGQSPLTFCGFGSFVRHVGRVASLIDYALNYDLLEAEHLRLIGAHQANLGVAWVFGRFMQPYSAGDPASVNRIMNIFCRALSEIGPAATVRFLQDRYTFLDYLRIMLITARYYPEIFARTGRLLGPRGLISWVGDITRFAADEAIRGLFHQLGAPNWKRLEGFAGSTSPALALRLKAMRTGWQAIA